MNSGFLRISHFRAGVMNGEKATLRSSGFVIQRRVGIVEEDVRRVVVDGDGAAERFFRKSAAPHGDGTQSRPGGGFNVVRGVADDDGLAGWRMMELFERGREDIRMRLALFGVVLARLRAEGKIHDAGRGFVSFQFVPAGGRGEGDLLAAVTNALPGVTGIDVGQVLHAFAGLLGEIGTAVSVVGLVALLAGGLVLVSATAAEREARIAEAVVLKTLGASRAQIRRAWLVEFAVAGGCAGLAAAIFGTLAAALTISEVFHTDWHFAPLIMIVTLLASVACMMIFGFVSTAQALREPAAARLRLETGG